MLWVEHAQWGTTSSSPPCAPAASRSSPVGPARRSAGGQRRRPAPADRARRLRIPVGWSLVDEVRELLWNMNPAVLAQAPGWRLDRRRDGYRSRETQKVSLGAAALDDPGYFVLPPCPTRCSRAIPPAGSSTASRSTPCTGRRGARVAQPAGHPAYHPMFKDAPFEFWYPERGEDGASGPGLRCGVAGGRRRHAHRQRHRAHRHERAQPGA